MSSNFKVIDAGKELHIVNTDNIKNVSIKKNKLGRSNNEVISVEFFFVDQTSIKLILKKMLPGFDEMSVLKRITEFLNSNQIILEL